MIKWIAGMVVVLLVVAVVMQVEIAGPATSNDYVKVAPYTFDDNMGLAPAYEITGWNVGVARVTILGVTAIIPKDIEVISVATCPNGFVITQKNQGASGTYRAIILNFNDPKFKEYVAKVVGKNNTKFVVRNEVRAINFYPDITVK
jgi:hypothetical protein